MEPSAKNRPALSNDPLVSVLICTHNRSEILGPTLGSLIRQNFAFGEFEILVVDNASTDNTKDVVAEYQCHDIRIRYLNEPRLGVAIARNRGAQASNSPYIAYFDDDQLAECDCLHHLISPFLEVKPTPSAVTGRVNLLWNGRRPAWFPKDYESLLSRFDRGSTARFMTADEYLITMNVAFERKTFLALGGIREDLSRMGRMLICSGDNEIFNRYTNYGLRIFYQPTAIAWHLVPKFRQTRSWFVKRVFGEGTSEVIAQYAKGSRRSLFKRLLYDSKTLAILVKKAFGDSMKVIDVIRYAGRLSAEIQLIMGLSRVRTLKE